MALYGYARVSTADQDCTVQEHALRAAGCEVRVIASSPFKVRLT